MYDSNMSLPILSKTKFNNTFIVYLRPEDSVVGNSSVVNTSVVVVGSGVVVPSKFFDFSKRCLAN